MSVEESKNKIVVETLEDAKDLILKYGVSCFDLSRYIKLKAPDRKCYEIDLFEFKNGIPVSCNNGSVVTDIIF